MSTHALGEAAAFAVSHAFAPLGCFLAVWFYVEFGGCVSSREKQAKNLLWAALALIVIGEIQPWYSCMEIAVARDFNATAWDACAIGFCLLAIRLRGRISFMAALMLFIACGLIGLQVTEWFRYW